MPQVSISLPQALIDVLEEKVKSGKYASQSEVVREALRHLATDQEDQQVSQFNAYLSRLMKYRKADLSDNTISEIIKRKSTK